MQAIYFLVWRQKKTLKMSWFCRTIRQHSQRKQVIAWKFPSRIISKLRSCFNSIVFLILSIFEALLFRIFILLLHFHLDHQCTYTPELIHWPKKIVYNLCHTIVSVLLFQKKKNSYNCFKSGCVWLIYLVLFFAVPAALHQNSVQQKLYIFWFAHHSQYVCTLYMIRIVWGSKVKKKSIHKARNIIGWSLLYSQTQKICKEWREQKNKGT